MEKVLDEYIEIGHKKRTLVKEKFIWNYHKLTTPPSFSGLELPAKGQNSKTQSSG